jgi:hypothetical protein
MGARLDPHFALGIPETRLSPDTERDQGVGTFDSSYTEAGPEPGHPEPDDPASSWRPELRAAQSVAMTVRTLQGGYAGRDGASVCIRKGSESTQADWLGWDDPNVICDFTAPSDAWGAAQTWSDVTAAVIPSTGVIVVVARSSTDAQTWSYNPRTGVWTQLYDWTTNPGLDSPLALVYDEESERLILFSGNSATAESRDMIAFQSVDGGSTWTFYARGQYNAAVGSSGVAKVAPAYGVDWLAFVDGDQYASSDRGQHWDQIVDAPAGMGHTPVRTDSGWAVFYANAGTDLCVRLLGSARASFSDAAEVVISSASGGGVSTGNLVACRDYDGVIYVVKRGTVADTEQNVTDIWRSLDGAVSFKGYGNVPRCDYWSLRRLVSSCGALWGVGFPEGHADVGGTWAVWRFGGWSNVEAGSQGVTLATSRTGRSSPGRDTADFWPTDLPQNQLWTRVGSAGTQSLDGADIGFEISATQAQQEQYRATAAAMSLGDVMSGQACIRVGAGTPDLGPSGVLYDSGLSFMATVSDGAAYTQARIEIGADGLKVWDGTTARSSLAIDMTAQWVHLRWYVRLTGSAGAVTIWYRTDATPWKWTRWANDDALARTVGVLASDMLWGHALAAIAGTAVLKVRFLTAAVPGSWYHQLDTLASSDDAHPTGVLGLWYGRPVPGRDGRVAVPDATASTEELAWLSGGGGSTYVSEVVELPVSHRYALRNVYADLSPSPRETWRAQGTDAAIVCWDQGANQESWYGGALGLLVRNGVPRQWVLEIDDGAGGWTTLGTLDKGWGSINYTLTGRSLMPRTGTATIGRYFGEDELVGGYVVCSTAGPSVARRIARQSPGFWTTDGTVQRLRITLDGTDGTETAAGTGDIVHHSGVLVAYLPNEVPRRRIRVRVGAAAITPEGYYEAGTIAVCRLVAVGAEPGWDWSRRWELSRTTERRADGRLVVRRTGPARRVVEYGWADGALLKHVRLLSESPDYLTGVSSSAPLGSEEDVAWSVPALVEHATRAGEVPILVIPQLPNSSGDTITDPTQYLFGLISSDSIGISSIQGEEGVDEAVRLDSLAVETIE